jgi:hypothetical protein
MIVRILNYPENNFSIVCIFIESNIIHVVCKVKKIESLNVYDFKKHNFI